MGKKGQCCCFYISYFLCLQCWPKPLKRKRDVENMREDYVCVCELPQIKKKIEEYPIKIMSHLSRYPTKENIRMTYNYMERNRTSLVFREKQIKTMMRHFSKLPKLPKQLSFKISCPGFPEHPQIHRLAGRTSRRQRSC